MCPPVPRKILSCCNAQCNAPGTHVDPLLIFQLLAAGAQQCREGAAGEEKKGERVRGLTDRPPETLAGNNRNNISIFGPIMRAMMEARKQGLELKKLSVIQLNLTPRGIGEMNMYLGSCVCRQVAKSPRGQEGMREWSRLSQPIVFYVGYVIFLSGLNRRCPRQGGGGPRAPCIRHLTFVT